MNHTTKYGHSSGKEKLSGGVKPGNMNAFMYSRNKRKKNSKGEVGQMFEVGDFIKGLPGTPYVITDEKMTRGVVTSVTEREIHVKVLEHENGNTGSYWVSPKYFEKVGHAKPFVRVEVIKRIKVEGAKALLEYDLRRANLSGANLSGADLRRADLSGAKG